MFNGRNRLSVVASTLGNDPRAIVRAARGAGFAAVVFAAQSSFLDLHELSQSGRREFRHMLAANELQLAAIHVDTGAKGFAPDADIDRVIARLDKALETAAGLGCKLICADAGPLPAPPPEPKPVRPVPPEEAGLIIIPTFGKVEVPLVSDEPSAPFDSAFASHVDTAMIEVGKAADRYGISIAWRSELAPLAAIHRMLAAASCHWFGVDLDPVGLLKDNWAIDEAFSRLGGLLRHVRVRDAVIGQNKLTKPVAIGQGSTDWPELLERLDEAGYAGWLTIDPAELADRATAAQAAAAYLKSLLRPA